MQCLTSSSTYRPHSNIGVSEMSQISNSERIAEGNKVRAYGPNVVSIAVGNKVRAEGSNGVQAPFTDAVWYKPEHCAQVLPNGNIEYMSDSKLIQMRAGKYLMKYSGHISIDDVMPIITAIKKLTYTFEVLTGEDLVEAYETEHSQVKACMSGRLSEEEKWSHLYDVTEHPATVYANSPDLKLAVMTSKVSGDICGRALVWPDKGLYGQTYTNGCRDEFVLHLAENGFRACDEDHNFTGARLPKMPFKFNGQNRTHLLMPYIDCTGGINNCWLDSSTDEKHFTIVKYDRSCMYHDSAEYYCADTTSGYISSDDAIVDDVFDCEDYEEEDC